MLKLNDITVEISDQDIKDDEIWSQYQAKVLIIVEKMKEEYRDQAIHQQERTDRTQDSALNYTTRVTESSQESNPTVTVNTNINAQPVFCPYCGGKATTADKNCPHCGESLED